MRKYQLLLIPFCLVLAAVSCEKAEDTPIQSEILSNTLESPNAFAKADYLESTFKGYTEMPEVAKIGLQALLLKLNAKMDQKMQDESGYMKPDWGYRRLVVRYSSVDSQGRPIQLRELIVFPEGRNWKHKVPQIILCSNITNTMNATVPTETSYFFSITAARDAIFICPDGQGFDETRDRDPLFIGIKLGTRQVLDGLWAAMDVLEEQNIALTPDHTFLNIGYSLGAATALSVHKEYEVSFTDAMRKRVGPIQSVCGAGPYNPAATLKWFKNQEDLTYAIGIPLAICGIREAHPDLLSQYPLESYFSQNFLDAGILEMLRSRNYSANFINDAIRKRVGSNYAKIISPALLDTSSPIYRTTLSAFARENILEDGWKAAYPIYLIQAKDDSIVPYLNSEYALQQLGSKAKLITSPSVPGVENHYSAAAFFGEKILTL